MTQSDEARTSGLFGHRKALFWATPLALGAIVLGAFVSCGHGHRFGHRGHGFGSPEEAREHIERHADWVMGRIDATEPQKERIVALVSDSVDELYELRDRHRVHHDEIVRLFTADEIDRAAIEALRLQELALLDEGSAVLATTLADVAEVLTPEQRAEVRDWSDHMHR